MINPDTTLEDIKKLIASVISETGKTCEAAAVELAAKITALDLHLRNGGNLPLAWKDNKTDSEFFRFDKRAPV